MAFIADKKSSFIPDQEPSLIDKAPDWLVPGYTKSLVRGYNSVKNNITDTVSKPFPNDQSYPHTVSNPMFPALPIPIGNRTPRKDAKELAGMGVDTVATMGLTEGIPALFKGAKVLPEIASSAVKGISKPFTTIGSEITPMAEAEIVGRLKSMEPEALRAVGVPENSSKFAQKVKGLTSIKELPTEQAANDYFHKIISNVPNDVNIKPENFQKATTTAISKLEGGLLKSDPLADSLRTMLKNSEGGITKEQFLNARREINNLYGTKEEYKTILQPVKEALDKDVSLASADMGSSAPIKGARIMYKLPRELKKANAYMDKSNLGSNLQRQLEEASKMGNVQKREELSSLIGPKAPEIFKSIRKANIGKTVVKGAGGMALFSALPSGLKRTIFHILTGQ